MAGPKDEFDPLMYLGNTDSTVAGSYEAPQKAGADSKRPGVLGYAGDGTAQLRSAANTKHSDAVPAASQENGDHAIEYDTFDSISLKRAPLYPFKNAKPAGKNISGAGG